MEKEYQYIHSLGLCGYLIRIENNNESVSYCWFSPISKKSYDQHAKVRYSKNNEPYFLANGRRIYLNQCVRIEKFGGNL